MAEEIKFDKNAFKQFEQEGYSRIAKEYNSITVKTTSQANPFMLDVVGVESGTRVLDIACGPGWLSRDAANRGADVVGLDLAEKMLDVARANCPQGEFHQGEADRLPFEDGSFDAVVCSLGILHFPDPETAMTEAHRVLVSGGKYAITCWLPPDKNPFMNLVLGTISEHGTMDVGLPPGPPLFRFGDPTECENALSGAGFVMDSTQELPLIWRMSSLDIVIDELKSGTARLAALLNMQTDEARGKIEESIVEKTKEFEKNGRYDIPAPVLLACGRKP